MMTNIFKSSGFQPLPGVSQWLQWVFIFGMFLFPVMLFVPVSGKFANNLFYGFIAIPTLIAACFAWRDVLGKTRDLWGLAALFFASALSAVALGEFEALKPVLYSALFCFAVLFLATREPGLTERIFLTFCICVIAAFLIATGEWVWQVAHEGEMPRVSLWGSAENPNFSALLTTSAFAYVWLFHLERRLVRPVGKMFGLFALVCAVMVAIVVFQSRTALLGFLLFVVFYGIFRGRVKYVSVAIGLVLLMLFLTGSHEVMIVRGLSYRPEIWGDALLRYFHGCSLTFGCGREEGVFLGKYHGTHSAYVGTIYRHGIVGLLGMSAFMVMYFARGFRSRSNWFLISLVGWGSFVTMLGGLTGSPSPWWIYFWFPCIAALACFAKGAQETPATARGDCEAGGAR